MSLILVAEDDSSIRECLQELLTEAGHDVVGVENGIKALEYLHHSTCDLLILDLKMPGMNGEELLAKIHEEGLRYLPILVISADVKSIKRLKELNVPALDKPFELDDLERLVKQCLQRSCASSDTWKTQCCSRVAQSL